MNGSFPGAYVTHLSNTSKYCSQMLSSPIPPQTSFIVNLQMSGCLPLKTAAPFQCLTLKALGKAQSPDSLNSPSANLTAARESPRVAYRGLPWILAALKPHRGPTSPCQAEAARWPGGAVQCWMDRGRPGLYGKVPLTRSQTGGRRDQTEEGGP